MDTDTGRADAELLAADKGLTETVIGLHIEPLAADKVLTGTVTVLGVGTAPAPATVPGLEAL